MTAILTHSFVFVPVIQSRQCSTAALAADIAEEFFLASMIAAPRFYTTEMKSPTSHGSSFKKFLMGTPFTVPWFTSGYYVEL
jgi:hypothetical protein